MKSIGRLRKNIGKKTHPLLVETLIAARKHKAWHALAHLLAASTRQQASVNLGYLDAHTKEGDTIIVTGKVLGTGQISKKIRICALAFSASAHHKLKAAKAETASVLEEIKKNPKAEGIRVLP